MSAEKCLCVIPARGGSKRIEKKNIRNFCGKPIIAYSIGTALEAGCFDEVMVSTDDPEIADVARNFCAAVPFMRSARTSDDMIGLAEVLVEVIQQYAQAGRVFPLTACVLATAPLVTSADLKSAMGLMENVCQDGIISVCRFSYPIQRALIERKGVARMKWPRYYRTRSQDLVPCYHDAGQFYILRTRSFLRQRKIFLPKMLMHELPETRVQDVDTEEDWKLAELKYNLING